MCQMFSAVKYLDDPSNKMQEKVVGTCRESQESHAGGRHA